MPEGERPRLATYAMLLMLGTGLATLGLGAYLLVSGGHPLGLFLTFFLGAVYAYGGRGLQRGESWGWGVGMFGGGLYLALGLFIDLVMLVPMALVVVVMALLIKVREHYGMVRSDPEAEARKREDLRQERTANPDERRCPHCGATTLWIAADGSAVCESCKAGTIAVTSPG